MLRFNDYSGFELDDTGEDVSLPDQVDSLEVVYDGGRFQVSVNGAVVYSNSCAGNDFSVEIN